MKNKKGGVPVIKTVGSICSGIEAASVAWSPLGLSFQWFSEIAPFPSRFLREKFSNVPNLGDMNNIPMLIEQGQITAPDLICGGTPCQAFSLAGGKNGLNDERGNLTLKFVDIIEANDRARKNQGKQPCIVFWENVEGVLKDKTNAFGCLVSSLAGAGEVLAVKSWPNAGLLEGKKRNVAWRVLDAKYFGLPQQRRRLYVIAGGKDFHPESVLFELHRKKFVDYPSVQLTFKKDGHDFEVFREYSDCLYSAYGTKWNGNAAAYNGSLFIAQDGRLRRLSPLECERLMGFPDNYTDIEGASRTNRYQAIGNSWAVPVVRWIGTRLVDSYRDSICFSDHLTELSQYTKKISETERFFDLRKDIIPMSDLPLNCTEVPEASTFCVLPEIVSADASEKIYISPVGCSGIVRRKNERNISINPRLEKIMIKISAQMPAYEIEKKSRIQPRGRFSQKCEVIKIAT